MVELAERRVNREGMLEPVRRVYRNAGGIRVLVRNTILLELDSGRPAGETGGCGLVPPTARECSGCRPGCDHIRSLRMPY
jgi:hypothetical protein